MQKKLELLLVDSEPASRNSLDGVLSLLSSIELEVSAVRVQKIGNHFYKNSNEVNLDDIYNLIKHASFDCAILGTSVENIFEHEILKILNKLRVKTFSIVDHWVNYKRRYTHNDEFVLPDVVIVNDDTAFHDAVNEGVPRDILKAWGNPWWVVLESKRLLQATTHPSQKFRKILFLSDNLEEAFENTTKSSLGYTEFEVLELLIDKINSFENYDLIIKPHPKEIPEKYDSYISSNVKLARADDDLFLLAQKTDLVVGMFSNALIDASFVNPFVMRLEPNKKLNLLPTAGIPCFESVEDLFEYASNRGGKLNKHPFAFKRNEFLNAIKDLVKK